MCLLCLLLLICILFGQNFHTYAKAEKRPSFFILDDTEHSYSRKTTVSGHSTPLKRKRNRNASTPTGETPKVIDKKQVGHCEFIPIFTRERERYEWINRQTDRQTDRGQMDKWTDRERERNFLTRSCNHAHLFQNIGTTIARWSEKEKNCLHSYLTKFPPTLPVSNEYWRNCAAAINQETGSSRTGIL